MHLIVIFFFSFFLKSFENKHMTQSKYLKYPELIIDLGQSVKIVYYHSDYDMLTAQLHLCSFFKVDIFSRSEHAALYHLPCLYLCRILNEIRRLLRFMLQWHIHFSSLSEDILPFNEFSACKMRLSSFLSLFFFTSASSKTD